MKNKPFVRYVTFEKHNAGTEILRFTSEVDMKTQGWIEVVSEWCEKHLDADWDRDSMVLMDDQIQEINISPKNKFVKAFQI